MYPKTIRLFEHQRIAVGEERPTLRGDSVVFEQRHFDALLRFNDANDGRFLLAGHRRLQMQQFVGFVQVDELGIEILPKADRHEAGSTRWREALLEMLRVAFGVPLAPSNEASLALREATLLELYLFRFLSFVDGLQREGLVRGYRRVRGNQPAFRGRLVVAENIRRNLTNAQRVYTEHQVYDHDVLVNRTLAAALSQLVHVPMSAPLRARLLRAHAQFPESVQPVADLRALDRARPTRNTERYQPALDLARLVLEHRSPSLQGGATRILALLFDMNILWERYVAALIKRAAPAGLRVSTQGSVRFWKPRGGRVRTVRPDIVVQDIRTREIVAVIDTKWKVPKAGSPADGDLKQMFAYNELYRCPRSVLLYPRSHAGQQSQRGAFETAGHHCETAYLDLFQAGRFDRSGALQGARIVLKAADDP